MTKSKSSASSMLVSSIFLIHLMNATQFLNATLVGLLYFVLMKNVDGVNVDDAESMFF